MDTRTSADLADASRLIECIANTGNFDPAGDVLRSVAAVGAGSKHPAVYASALRDLFNGTASDARGDAVVDRKATQRSGLAIFLLARSSEFRTCAQSVGLAAIIVRVVSSAVDSADSMRYLCDALSNLCVAPECQVAVAAAGGIPVLLSVLERHSADPDVSESACCALQNLADHPPNQAAIGRAGGVAAITSVLARHATSAAVTGAACGALRNLADCAENLPRLVSVSAAALLASALSAHQSDTVVVEAACGALESLAEGGQRRTLLHSGLPDLLVAFLSQSHPPKSAVSLLATVADYGRSRGSIALASAVPLLIGISERLGDDASAVIAATRALWFLSREDVNKQAMFDAGIFCSLSATLRRFVRVPGVVIPIATIFNNIARVEETKLEVFRSGSLSLFIDALKAHPEDVALCDACLTALWCLLQTEDPAPRREGNAAGVARLATAALTAHLAYPQTTESAVGALMTFASGSSDYAEAVKDAGGIAALVSALRAYVDDDRIVSLACGGLSRLAQDPRTADTVTRDATVIAAARAASAAHPADSKGGAAARRLLSRLGVS